MASPIPRSIPRFRRFGPFFDRLPFLHVGALAGALGLAGGGRVLDLGGGTGRVSVRLATGRPETAFLVADLERDLLRRARRKGLLAVQADARALPFRDGTFAALFSVDAFHHMDEPRAVLAEADRVVVPRGRIALVEFDPRSFGGRIVRLAERFLRFGSHFHSPEELVAIVERAMHRKARVTRLTARDYMVVAGERLDV